MLQTTKSITINGISETYSGEVIATMHCSINESGEVSSSQNIQNRTLYEAHKDIVRADLDEFTALCRETEDNANIVINSEYVVEENYTSAELDSSNIDVDSENLETVL